MITIEQYAGGHETSPDWTPERQKNAQLLLNVCALLQAEMESDGIVFPNNPKTGSKVGGQFHGFGGFRPQNCPQGAPHSSHKEGLAVDLYDPHNEIDDYLQHDYLECVADGKPQDSMLVRHGVYIEHPDSTDTWSHWSIKPPKSGKHIFNP